MVELTVNTHFPPGIPWVYDIEVKDSISSIEKGL